MARQIQPAAAAVIGLETTIKLAVPHREHAWWRRLWEKILSPFPNGNAVENRPAFTS